MGCHTACTVAGESDFARSDIPRSPRPPGGRPRRAEVVLSHASDRAHVASDALPRVDNHCPVPLFHGLGHSCHQFSLHSNVQVFILLGLHVLEHRQFTDGPVPCRVLRNGRQAILHDYYRCRGSPRADQPPASRNSRLSMISWGFFIGTSPPLCVFGLEKDLSRPTRAAISWRLTPVFKRIVGDTPEPKFEFVCI